MIILDCEQGTEEWLRLRRGVPSASMFDKILTATGKPSSQSEGYFNELLAERWTGKSTNFHVSDAMKRGTDLEPEAKTFYELFCNVEVVECGFVLHSSREFGCSPDGLVGQKGLEIKCPTAKTHVQYLRLGKVPTKYVLQVQGCMAVTGFQAWDFMSYHPDMPPMIVEVKRDESLIEKLLIELDSFTTELKSEMVRLKNETQT